MLVVCASAAPHTVVQMINSKIRIQIGLLARFLPPQPVFSLAICYFSTTFYWQCQEQTTACNKRFCRKKWFVLTNHKSHKWSLLLGNYHLKTRTRRWRLYYNHNDTGFWPFVPSSTHSRKTETCFRLFCSISILQTNLPHKWSLLLETVIRQVFSKTELPPLAATASIHLSIVSSSKMIKIQIFENLIFDLLFSENLPFQNFVSIITGEI